MTVSFQPGLSGPPVSLASGEAVSLVPHSLDAERFLLGALLLSESALDKAAGIVTGNDFYKPLHGNLFDILVQLRKEGKPLDPAVITAAFGSSDRGVTVSWIRSLSVDVPTFRNAEYYARIVAATALRRRIFETATAIAHLAYDPARNCEDVLNEAEQLIYNLRFAWDSRIGEGGWFRTLVPAVRAALDNPAPARTSTGFSELDGYLVGGFGPGDLVLLAARPGVGKSTLALQFAVHAARIHGPVFFFSLEMTPTSLMERLFAAQGKVPHDRVRSRTIGQSDRRGLDQAAAELAALPLWLDNKAATVTEIGAHCRRLAREEGPPSLVVIDYLQLLRPERANASRYEQVTGLSREVKLLAVDLGVPILALSQLNRASEHRSDQTPVLANLRDSGSLEQDADTVLLLYPRSGDAQNPPSGTASSLATLAIAKNRHGPIASVPVLFIRRQCQFSEQGYSH